MVKVGPESQWKARRPLPPGLGLGAHLTSFHRVGDFLREVPFTKVHTALRLPGANSRPAEVDPSKLTAVRVGLGVGLLAAHVLEDLPSLLLKLPLEVPLLRRQLDLLLPLSRTRDEVRTTLLKGFLF